MIIFDLFIEGMSMGFYIAGATFGFFVISMLLTAATIAVIRVVTAFLQQISKR